jgi:hypothetical protein
MFSRKNLSGELRPFWPATFVLIGAMSAVVWIVSIRVNFFDKFYDFSQKHQNWQFDEIFSVAVFLMVAFGVIAVRRWRDART